MRTEETTQSTNDTNIYKQCGKHLVYLCSVENGIRRICRLMLESQVKCFDCTRMSQFTHNTCYFDKACMVWDGGSGTGYLSQGAREVDLQLNIWTSGESPVLGKRRTEERLLAIRDRDRARNKTRINICLAFQRWRKLRDLKCCCDTDFFFYYSTGE